MAVPQWRRASRKPPGNGVLPKDDGVKCDAPKDGCPRIRSPGTVARRHGVIRFGGAFLPTGRRPLFCRLPAWRWLCAAGAASRRLPIQPFHRSLSAAGTFWHPVCLPGSVTRPPSAPLPPCTSTVTPARPDQVCPECVPPVAPSSDGATKHGPDAVIPAEAGIHKPWYATHLWNWIPAFAGMTIQGFRELLLHACKYSYAPAHTGCPAEQNVGRLRPHYCEYPEPGPVAPARRSGLVMKYPRATEGRVPGSAWMRPWDVRARDWTDCRHDEPVLACDCDLRFSFP